MKFDGNNAAAGWLVTASNPDDNRERRMYIVSAISAAAAIEAVRKIAGPDVKLACTKGVDAFHLKRRSMKLGDVYLLGDKGWSSGPVRPTR